jgi:outer membrane protein assembly factor BamB
MIISERMTKRTARTPLKIVMMCALALAACGRQERLPGEREPLREGYSEPEASAPARPISLPAAMVNADWAQRNGSPTGMPIHAALAPVPRLRWSRDIGEGSGRRSRLLVRPVVAGGLVFAVDAAGRLTALTRQGGAVWTTSLVPEGQDPKSGPGGGLAVTGGVLYAGTGFGEVLAIDPTTGGIYWRKSLEAPIRSAPVVDGGKIFVVMRDDKALALSTGEGEELWEVESSGGTGLLGGASPAVSGNLAVIPFTSGELRGVTASSGLWQWGTAITAGRPDLARSGIGDITGDPVIVGSSVYASSQNGRTIKMDRLSGERLWTTTQGAYGPLWPMGGSIFLVSDEGKLVRLDAMRGEEIWAVALPEFHPNRSWFGDRTPFRAITHFGPVLAGGRLWVASGDAHLRGFSPVNGELLAEITLPAGAAAAPAVADRVMYIVTDDGRLLALQ